MMKYLITGGAGFIGSNIVEELVKRNEFVRVLDNFSTGKEENLAEFKGSIELVRGDISDIKTVREAVNGVDVVLHQAALPSVPRSVMDPITSNEVNVTGTLNVLWAAKEAGVKRLVYASSSSVYGNNPELPKHEGMVPNPLSPYAVSKLAAEKYAVVFSNLYGVKAISLRYFNVFGPRQDPSSQYSAVIPKFITAMLENKSPVIYGDGEQSRDFTYIDNVVEANLLAASSDCGGGVFLNCASNSKITLNELVARINELLSKNIMPVYSDERSGDVKHSYANIQMARDLIGYDPKVSFMEGLRKTISWYAHSRNNRRETWE